MAGTRVPVLAPDPKTGRLRFATVDESEADVVVRGGGKLLTKAQAAEQEAEQRQDAEYDATPTIGKIAGAVTTAAGALNPLMLGGAPGTAGAAYNRGVARGLSAGTSDAAIRAGVDAAAGKPAGARLAQSLSDQRTAHGTAFGAGELAGMAAGAALPATPSGAINVAGNVAERGAGALLRGLSSRGTLGRALGAGGRLAVRGAVEGGVYGGVTEAADAVVRDEEITGAKLYAAAGHGALAGAAFGGTLGFGGSLAASGAKAAGAAFGKGVTAALQKAGSHDIAGAAKKLGNDEFWAAIGKGQGLQSTRYAKQAQRHFPNGTTDLGEVGMRYNLLEVPAGATPAQAALHAGKTGTAAEIAPRAIAAKERVGSRLGEITEASGARIAVGDLDDAIMSVRGEYASKAGFEHVVAAIDDYRSSLYSHLKLADPKAARVDVKGLKLTASVQDVLEQRKALDQLVYQETKTLDPKARVGALREVRARMEGVVTDALDGASGKVAGETRKEYVALKRDYHALSIIAEAAEDSAARSAKAATFGLTDKIIGSAAGAIGTMIGGPVGGLVAGPGAAYAAKLVRERGSAAAAAYLSRSAESGMFARLVRQSDEAVERAARGALASGAEKARPAKGITPPRTRTEVTDSKADQAALKKHGQSIVEWVGQTKANPRRVLDAIAEASEMLGQRIGPRAASTYSAQAMKAYMFVAKYVPEKERRDPLDPNSVPPLTLEEADSLVRAATYATRPQTVWKDFQRGVVTPEGLDAANELMPEQFQEFRLKLLSHVHEHMLRNKQLTQSQRLRIDKLLGLPAGADLKPSAILRDQQDFLDTPQAEPGPQGPTGKPVNMKIQNDGFDAVTARMTG